LCLDLSVEEFGSARMDVIDNISKLLGDDLKSSLRPGSKFSIAASAFSIYAYEALKSELEAVESVQFIFTRPTFVPNEVTDKAERQPRQFQLQDSGVEQGFFGTEFEIHLKNKLTQRAIATISIFFPGMG